MHRTKALIADGMSMSRRVIVAIALAITVAVAAMIAGHAASVANRAGASWGSRMVVLQPDGASWS